MKRLISICGSDSADNKLGSNSLGIAEKLGFLIGKNGFILVCGGKGGIMQAASKGCKKAGGTTIGILPYSKEEANQYIDCCLLKIC